MPSMTLSAASCPDGCKGCGLVAGECGCPDGVAASYKVTFPAPPEGMGGACGAPDSCCEQIQGAILPHRVGCAFENIIYCGTGTLDAPAEGDVYFDLQLTVHGSGEVFAIGGRKYLSGSWVSIVDVQYVSAAPDTHCLAPTTLPFNIATVNTACTGLVVASVVVEPV